MFTQLLSIPVSYLIAIALSKNKGRIKTGYEGFLFIIYMLFIF